jgi:hypothetical protein
VTKRRALATGERVRATGTSPPARAYMES